MTRNSLSKFLDKEANKTRYLHGAAAETLEALALMMQHYGRLHDMLSDMIESGRLTEADCPDDYQAIVEQLAGPCNKAMDQSEKAKRKAEGQS